MFNLEGFVRIHNSIFWKNSGPEVLEEQQIDGTTVSEGLTVDHCDIQGLGSFFGGVDSFYGGVGNIGADPGFVDPDSGAFGLRPGSAAIDAGRNAEVPADIETDLNGRIRFVDDLDSPDCVGPDADCGTAPIVDMGALEFQGGAEPIPTVSQWGIICMGLLLLTAGSLLSLLRNSQGHMRSVRNRLAK